MSDGDAIPGQTEAKPALMEPPYLPHTYKAAPSNLASLKIGAQIQPAKRRMERAYLAKSVRVGGLLPGGYLSW